MGGIKMPKGGKGKGKGAGTSIVPIDKYDIYNIESPSINIELACPVCKQVETDGKHICSECHYMCVLCGFPTQKKGDKYCTECILNCLKCGKHGYCNTKTGLCLWCAKLCTSCKSVPATNKYGKCDQCKKLCYGCTNERDSGKFCSICRSTCTDCGKGVDMVKGYLNSRTKCNECYKKDLMRSKGHVGYYTELYQKRTGFRRFFTNVCDSLKQIEHPLGKVKMFYVDFHPDGRRYVGKIHFQHLVFRSFDPFSQWKSDFSNGGPRFLTTVQGDEYVNSLIGTNFPYPVWKPDVYDKIVAQTDLKRPNACWNQYILKRGLVSIYNEYKPSIIKESYVKCVFCDFPTHLDDRCIKHNKKCKTCGVTKVINNNTNCVACDKIRFKRVKRVPIVDDGASIPKRIKLTTDFGDNKVPIDDINNLKSKIEMRKDKILNILDAMVAWTEKHDVKEFATWKDKNEMEKFVKDYIYDHS